MKPEQGPRLAPALRRQRLAHFLVWATPALWSSNYLIARAAHGHIAPHALALGRWGLALLLMLPFAGAALWAGRQEVRQHGGRYLLLGALGMWVCGAFVYLGGQATTAVNIGLIYAASPVAIAVLGTRLAGQRMAPAQQLGAALALAGVLWVVARGDPANLLAVRLNRGDAWIAVAAVCWTAYSLLLARWPSTLPPLARLAAITAGGVLVLLPATLLEWWIVAPPPPTATGWGLVGLAALVPGVLSYGAYSFMMRELGPARSALALYLAPLYGALLAWVLLGEPPAPHHAVGAALILPAIWLATRKG